MRPIDGQIVHEQIEFILAFIFIESLQFKLIDSNCVYLNLLSIVDHLEVCFVAYSK